MRKHQRFFAITTRLQTPISFVLPMLFISSIAAQVSERGTGSRTIRGFESIEIGGKQGTSEVKSILF